ncbi:hypothetical protein [Treponema sp. R80B11-R83G3]
MNERESKILEQAQIEEFEDWLIAKFNESGRADYYSFLQEIFINFVNDKIVLDSFMKNRMQYRNMEQSVASWCKVDTSIMSLIKQWIKAFKFNPRIFCGKSPVRL